MYNVCTKVEQNMKYPNKLFQVSLSKNEDVSCRYDFCIHASFTCHNDAFDYIIKLIKPNQICGFNYFCIKVCGSYEEAISTKSYYDTKLVRFIMLTSLTTSSIGSAEAFRFVPDPGAFDHIFTDQELYEKYQLTNEEINIIESVIKERK